MSRLKGPKPASCISRLRQRQPRGIGHRLEIQLRPAGIVGHIGRHKSISRPLAQLHHFPGHRLAVIDQIERAAHAHIGQRRIAQIDRDIGQRQRRHDVQRARHVGPQPRQLGAGQRRLHVQLAGAQPAQRRLGIGGGKIIHRLDLHTCRIIEAGIFDQRDVIIGHPAFER